MLVGGVVRGRLDEARKYAVTATFSTGAVVAYFPTPTPINVVNGFRVRFCRLGRALIRFSSKSNDI